MNTFKVDKKRYRELTNSSPYKELAMLLVYLFRVNKTISKIRLQPLRSLISFFFIPIYKLYSAFLGISLPRATTIDSGFIILHLGAIVINENAIIGKNCTIRQGVTIGSKNKGEVPTIGDNVNFGAGAVVFGKIRIGNNVDIGANAVVYTDVPDNHIAVGNPARILPKKEK